MIATTAMEVNAEARRILAVSISKAVRLQEPERRAETAPEPPALPGHEIEMPSAAQPTPEPRDELQQPGGKQIVSGASAGAPDLRGTGERRRRV
ncbi:hypothetical protein KUCAC02_035914, partial [Chaenocephalus aceratus]